MVTRKNNLKLTATHLNPTTKFNKGGAKLKRKEILDTLENSEEPLKVGKLSERTGISKARLRVNLYRLQEEGAIESVQKEGEIRWGKKEKNPEEEKYEKMSENPT